VTEFRAGDRVFGNSGLRFGAHAEYLCVRESARITHMPAGSSFAEAAAVPDGVQNAMSCLRAAKLKPGQRILVYGASGAIGTAAVQLARHFGLDVTAVTSTSNLEVVRSLGPDRVIDRGKEDFTRNGETYDSIFDAVGKHSFKGCKGSLTPGGTYLPTDGARNLFLALWTARGKGRRVLFPAAPRSRKEDLLLVRDLMEKGEYRPVIDRRYAMDQVREAARYVDTEQKVGSVVLVILGDGDPPP
jgi:NADPH:quinone reductase-like Zn-dependent oxidoreductase